MTMNKNKILYNKKENKTKEKFKNTKKKQLKKNF